jgi:hypothetical protein
MLLRNEEAALKLIHSEEDEDWPMSEHYLTLLAGAGLIITNSYK